MELLGPPLTSLQGLVLTVFEENRTGTTMALPLTSITDHNGFYLIGNVTGAGESRVMFTKKWCETGRDYLHNILKRFVALINSNLER